MDIQEVLRRGNRSVEADSGTTSAMERMIREVESGSTRLVRRPMKRRLLIALPAAIILAGGLSAGGTSIVNSLTTTPDAVLKINYTATDGSHVSCEVAITATSKSAKAFVQHHDWSDISGKVQQAGQPGPEATPGAVGSSSRSTIDIIDSEIPSNVWGGELINFATSCP
jgi:hypothetical protein